MSISFLPAGHRRIHVDVNVLVAYLESVSGMMVMLNPKSIMFPLIARQFIVTGVYHLLRYVNLHKSIHFKPHMYFVPFNPPECDNLQTRW